MSLTSSGSRISRTRLWGQIIHQTNWERMNEWCIYIAKRVLYCCTPKAFYNHVGWGSLLNHHQCALGWCHGCHRTTVPVRSPHTSYRWRGERDIEPIKCMRSPHTSYRWRGERVIEPIKCMLSPHTSYRWRGERVIESIKCMPSPHISYRWRGERDIEPIKCMPSPHTSYRWRGESHRANQVYALTTHQLQVERRES